MLLYYLQVQIIVGGLVLRLRVGAVDGHHQTALTTTITIITIIIIIIIITITTTTTITIYLGNSTKCNANSILPKQIRQYYEGEII